jgi:hypothetical protein
MDRQARTCDSVLVKRREKTDMSQNTTLVAGGRRGKDDRKTKYIGHVAARDGILGHQFHKRLESFAPCFSQLLLLADFKENQPYSSLILKILTKKSVKQENSSLFMNSIL